MVGLLLPENNTEGDKCSIKTPDSSIQTSRIAGVDAAGLGDSLGAGTGQSTNGEVWEDLGDLDGVMGLCSCQCSCGLCHLARIVAAAPGAAGSWELGQCLGLTQGRAVLTLGGWPHTLSSGRIRGTDAAFCAP